jgi:hypothetical protein
MRSVPTEIAQDLLPLLRQFVKGDYGIALGGAHAKGLADAESDVDFYLFAREILSNEERARLCREFGIAPDSITVWGTHEPFSQAGTDFYRSGHKIECWLRNSALMSETIAECQAGVVRRDLVTWTVTGFYNHCALSDLCHMQPLDDPAALLAGWQAAVREYPPLLRETIIDTHLRAAQFWPDNFHYDSAVQRGDVIYVMSIVHQVIHNLIQVVFALNRTYFPGDKKLHIALDQLDTIPADFVARIERLMLPTSGTPASFTQQRAALQELVREVTALTE